MTAGQTDPLSRADEPAAARHIRAAAEVVLFSLVAITPWPFGAVSASWELTLYVGFTLLAGLWAAHAVVTRRFTYRSDPVSVCLLGLVLVTAVQLVPLPESVVRVLSPVAAEWHRTLRPEAGEVLPGEADAVRRSVSLPLSIDPADTRQFLTRVTALFLVYAVCRNLIASKQSFKRLAW